VAVLQHAWPELLLLAVALVAGTVAWRSWQGRRLTDGARSVTILAPPTVDPAGVQALWANLHGLIRPSWRARLAGQPYLAFELVWTPRQVDIRMWVPGTVPPELVERAIAAAWPGAQTRTEAPEPPLPLTGSAAGGELRLVQPEWFPLNLDQQADPLRAVFGSVGGLREGESACVQVLARPVGARRLARARHAARALRSGQSTTRRGRLLDLLRPGSSGRRPSDDPTIAPDVRLILAKAAGQGWEAAVRYGVSSPVQGPATRRQLRGRAHALAAAYAGLDGRNRLERHRLRQPARALAARRLRRADLVSVAELAMLAHLPADAAVPGLARAAARSVAPAPWLCSVGKVLGDANAGPPRPVAITAADARHHLHVVGATGVGKSTLIVNMVLDDVAQRHGVVVVDPSGDLVNDLLDRLPAEVGERLVLLDPSEDQAPPILNMLDGPDPDLAVDHVVGIFSRIYGSYWGPRTDDILRACCLTLLRQPQGEVTLADVPRLLGDAEFRGPYVQAVASDAGLEGFWSWYEQLTGWARAQAVGPVLNKLRAFFLRPFVNRVVAGGASSFDLDRLLDNGGVLLARVPKGLLGEETSRLLGSFVLSKVWQSATHRAKVGERARRDTCAYADEAHNFLNLPIRFDEALAEARKYRLSLCLAHQYLGQLPRELREAISANARNKLIFAVSPEDASALERHVAPELTAHDLANLGAFQAAGRLVAGGAEQPACTLRTRPAPAVVPGRASALRIQARQRFGRTDQQRHRQGVRQQVGADEAAARQHPGSAADTGLTAPPTAATSTNRRQRQ
jgi:Type IV secretion-system coupling protein DNA-binding domain